MEVSVSDSIGLEDVHLDLFFNEVRFQPVCGAPARGSRSGEGVQSFVKAVLQVVRRGAEAAPCQR